MISPTAGLLLVLLLGPAQQAGPQAVSPQAPVPEAADSASRLARPDSAPVLFRGDTLGFLFGPLGPFSVEERAGALAERLRDLRSQGARPEGVRVVEVEGRLEVWVDDAAVAMATVQDSIGQGGSPAQAADALAGMVRAGLGGAALTRSTVEVLLGLLWTTLVTLALVGIIRLMAVWYPRLYQRIREIQSDKLPALRFQQLELVSGEQIEAGILLFAKATRLVLTGLLLFLYFPLVFSFFPPTRTLAQRIFALALEPTRLALAAVVGYLPNLFYIAVILILAHYVLKAIKVVFTAVAHETIRVPGFYPDWALPTFNLVRVLALAFAVILIWPYLPNSDSLAFKGVAGFLGLLLTFGSAGAVSNVVGGVVMIYMRPFLIGDRVKIADTVGDVMERGMLVTRLRTPKNVEVTIPNSMVLGTYIVNYSAAARKGGVILHTTVTLGYDLDWRKVHDVMKAAAAKTPGVLQDPPPFVLQTALGDYSVSYELNAHTDQPEAMARIYSGLHQNLQDCLAEAGIEILSPTYHALRDGNLSTIPAPHAPPEAETPAFRVRKSGE